MSSRELNPEWVLSAFLSNTGRLNQDHVSELAIVARRLWPRVQSHARKELTDGGFDDAIVLATDVWEALLRSVAKTMQRSEVKNWQPLNLEAYLFGAFNHRFNRAVSKERRRRQKHLPLGRYLERSRSAVDSAAAADLDRAIQIKEAVESMDEWTRRVWMARRYGLSWKEIAKYLELTEPQAKLRFRYAIGRLRARFSNDARDSRRLDQSGRAQYAGCDKLGRSV
jgi:DNA-directed RNA polymerase specialized sigma24 family protein